MRSMARAVRGPLLLGAAGLRRLDQLRAGGGLAVGAGLGLLAGGAAMAWPDALGGYVAAGLSLGGAAALALTGAPVGGLHERLLDMVDLPAGRFWMGSPEEEEGRYADEGPVHEVEVLAFALGRHPVTQREYASVMGQNPGDPKGKDLPVNNVSYYDAVAFCNRLSEREGMRPCYVVAPKGHVTWDQTADGYRLPTEAEWEYAARAGMQTAYFFGDDPAVLKEYAWYVDNADMRLHPVKGKRPNPWGLHDMLGNIWEWCWNAYAPYDRPIHIETIPPNLARVLRGGSFDGVPRDLRSAIRNRYRPPVSGGNIGFRCAWSPARQPL